MLSTDRPVRTDQSRNGVSVVVTRTAQGSTVQADCQCLGLTMRTHSLVDCPHRLAARPLDPSRPTI